MKNSFKLNSTVKEFEVIFDGVEYLVQIEYIQDSKYGMINDIFRMDGQDYVFDEDLLNYISNNL